MSSRQCDFGCRWPVFAGEHLNADIYQQLLDSIHALRSRGRILTENTLFSGFIAVLHCQNRPAAVGGLHVSGGLAAIFAGLEFAGQSYLMCFAGKSPGYASIKSCHALSICRHGTGPASGDIFPQNMRQENKVKTEQIVSQQLGTYLPSLFRPKMNFIKTWGLIHWKKNHFSPRFITPPCM